MDPPMDEYGNGGGGGGRGHGDDTSWWHALFTKKFTRLLAIKDIDVPLYDFLDHTQRDRTSGLHQMITTTPLTDICPTLWKCIMAVIPWTEQRQVPFLSTLPYALDPTAILHATDGTPHERRSKSESKFENPTTRKRTRNGFLKVPKEKEKEQEEEEEDLFAPDAYTICALISVLSFRISLLLSHAFEDPRGLWKLVADQAMDLIATTKGTRDTHRTDKAMETLLFSGGLLANLEKWEFNTVREASKAVVFCLRQLYQVSSSSNCHLFNDYRACVTYSNHIYRLVGCRRGRARPPPPGDLWTFLEGPLPYPQITMYLSPDRAARKQFLARVPGFGTGISASGETSFSWFLHPNSDKLSLIRSLRSAEFLAFAENARNIDTHQRWVVLPVASRPDTYLLGLRKDSELVLRYACAVLRLKRWRFKVHSPQGKCNDLPSYMIVYRHILAVLEDDLDVVPRQHQRVVLQLSILAIMSWFDMEKHIGKHVSVNANVFVKFPSERVISAPDIDPYGFRILMTRGLKTLFKSSHGNKMIRGLWNRVATVGAKKKKKESCEEEEEDLSPDCINFLELLATTFLVGRQSAHLPERVKKYHDFEDLEDDNVQESERKAYLCTKYGKVFIKSRGLAGLRSFFTTHPKGQKMANRPEYSSLFNIVLASSNNVETTEGKEEASSTTTSNYVTLMLRGQELSYDPSGDSQALIQLPLSDILLKTIYRLIDDPITPTSIRLLLLSSVIAKTEVLQSIPRSCFDGPQRAAMKVGFSKHLGLRDHITDAELFSNGRMRLMCALLLVEMTGLKRVKTASRDFFAAVPEMTVVDPDHLAQLPLSMVPVAFRSGGISTYGNMLALPSARYYDSTWGSPALGLHEEVLGMRTDPDKTLNTMLSETPQPQFSSATTPSPFTLRESTAIARAFCQRMTDPLAYETI